MLGDCPDSRRRARPRHSPAHQGRDHSGKTVKNLRKLPPHPSEVTIADNSNWSKQEPQPAASPRRGASFAATHLHSATKSSSMIIFLHDLFKNGIAPGALQHATVHARREPHDSAYPQMYTSHSTHTHKYKRTLKLAPAHSGAPTQVGTGK